MANTINFILTNSAAELIPKVLNGKTLNFTRMAVGDGFSYGETISKGFKTLVNEVLSIDITKKEILSPSSVKITSAFKNTDAQQEFYYREVGLFAQDPDTGEEVLYAYGNRNDAAELITPTGSNVVNKQLIFVITVGDSANVTFNVNADVYALQSDMLNAQTDIEGLQSNMQQAQANITTLQSGKANKNLANTGMITNCLLEVPQRIKYEWAYGALIIKAGSQVIIPDGFEEDGVTKKFIYKTLEHDVTLDNLGFATGNLFITYGKTVWRETDTYEWFSDNIYSSETQPTDPSNLSYWYDIKNNYIKTTMDSGVTWTISSISFPFLNLTSLDGAITFLNQVFNGMGYFDSIVWVDKGVKGLIPNGRNPDGTLNNIAYTTSNLAVKDCSEGDYSDINFFVNTEGRLGHNFLYESEKIRASVIAKTYIPLENTIYGKDGTIYKEFYIAKGTIENKKITLLKPYTAFKVVNKSSDKPWLSSLAMPSERYIELELGERGTIYTAPANGWFAIRKDAGFINAQVSLAVWNYDETFEFFRTTMSSPAENVQIAFFVPILKGQKLAVDYDATGLTIYFRFIYAQGETN